jgi:putative thiamine transport system ATP-binding protein
MLEIRNLTISQRNVPLFADFSLSVAPGEIVTLTGGSGSGKSTLLNWIVGNLDPTFGSVGQLWLDGTRRDMLPTERRNIGLLFQDDLLFPHFSVGHNLAFALPSRIQTARQRRDVVSQTLASIGLPGFENRDPATLSGGQRARVSLMRSLLAEPCALLLDEPFSKLDATLRLQFRSFVFEQIERLRTPTLLVTHDLADAPSKGRVIDINGLGIRLEEVNYPQG